MEYLEQSKYGLEKYHGKASRHECPNCHDKASFSYYIDEAGNILDRSCGRCNHESGCGYHYTPRQYFLDNKTHQTQTPAFNNIIRQGEHKAVSFIDRDVVYKFQSTENNLIFFLCQFFNIDTLMKAAAFYFLGSTQNRFTIWWQIDERMKVRTGKIIPYDDNTGHRIKEAGVNWVHSKLSIKDYNLQQCLFGLHLLNVYPEKPIALVEAEKSAFICSMINDKYVWLACGGKSQISTERLAPIKNRMIVLYPDYDGYELWNQKATELNRLGFDIRISSFVERNANGYEREHGGDIADILLRLIQDQTTTAKISDNKYPNGSIECNCPNQEIALDRMVSKNPDLQVMIDKFGLCIS